MSIRLRPADRAAIKALIDSGLARNKSQAISYALAVAARAAA